MKIDGVGNLCLYCMEEMGNSSRCPHCGHSDPYREETQEALPAGSIIGWRYLIGHVICKDIEAISYIAYDLKLHIKRRIQECFPSWAVRRCGNTVKADHPSKNRIFQKALDTFCRKAQSAAYSDGHPNAVCFCDYLRYNGTSYLVLDYFDGIMLEQYLKSHGGRLDGKEAWRILKPIADVLRKLHSSGFANWNVCPDNIWITRQGTSLLFPELIDADDHDSEDDGSLPIRCFYAPYERYARRMKKGTYTDVYVLAAILYHAVSGIEPSDSLDRFMNDSLIPLKDLNLGIPKLVSEAVSRAMAMRIAERTQNMAEFMQAMDYGLRETEQTLIWNNAGVISAAMRNAQVGDHLFYGHYEQDKNLSKNGPEPIEWRVLAREGNHLLLLSEYGLDLQYYGDFDKHSCAWEESYLRGWLNGEFYENAFNMAEQRQIAEICVKAEKNPAYDTDPGSDTKDKIFLLNIREVNTYLKHTKDRQIKLTAYAKDKVVHTGPGYYGVYELTGGWWLRSPGRYKDDAAYVNNDGSITSTEIYHFKAPVRPAFWLNL